MGSLTVGRVPPTELISIMCGVFQWWLEERSSFVRLSYRRGLRPLTEAP